MPEPLLLITVLAGVAGKLVSGKEKKELVPEVAGDAVKDLTKLILNKGYEKIKEKWAKGKIPKGDPFPGPLRESKLFATDLLINAVKEKIEFLEALAQPGYPAKTAATLNRAYQAWRKAQAADKDYVSYLPEGRSGFESIEKIIQAKTEPASREKLIAVVKQQFYTELSYGLGLHGFDGPMPRELREYLQDGWEKEGKRLDWFELFTLRFIEVLEDPAHEKLSKAFFTDLLVDIKSDTGLLLLKLQELTQEMQEQSTQIGELHKNIGGRLSIGTLRSSHEIMTLLERKATLKAIVAAKWKEYEEKSELVRVQLTEEHVEAKLIAKGEWQQASNELSQADAQINELREFINTTYDLFSKMDTAQIDGRLQRAREFFQAAQFDLVRDLLSSPERERERESIIRQDQQVLEKKQRFAAEDLLLAKTDLIDFANKNRYVDAERHFRLSIGMCEGLYNCFNYALFLLEQNRHREAITFFERSLQYTGRSDDAAAAALNNLGVLYKDILDYDRAEKCYLQTLSIYSRKKDRENEKKAASTLDNLGILYRERNEFSLAVTNSVKALNIRRDLAGSGTAESSLELITTLNNVGILYKEMGQFGAALNCYQEALAIAVPLAERQPEKFELPLAMLRSGTGSLQFELKQFDAAEGSLLQALSLIRKYYTLNPEGMKPELGKKLSNIGVLYNARHEFEKAKEYLEEALSVFLDLCHEKPGAFEPDLANTYGHLGVYYRGLGRFDDAIGNFEKELSLLRELAEQNRQVFESKLAEALNSLGAIQKDLEDYAQAEKHFLEALAIQKQLAEKEPQAFEPFMGMILSNLGIVYEAMGRLEMSEEKFQESLALRRKLSEVNPVVYDPDVADTLQRQASLYVAQQKYDLARIYFREALAMYAKYFYNDRPFFGGRILAVAYSASAMAFQPEVWDVDLGLYYLRIVVFLMAPFRGDAANADRLNNLDDLLKALGSSLEQEFEEVKQHPPI